MDIRYNGRFVRTLATAGIVGLLVLFLFAGCDTPFNLTEVLDGTTGEPLGVEPGSLVLQYGESFQFQASGGSPPYRYDVAEGQGSIEESTGLYTAPAGASTDTVRVTDSFGATREATVVVNAGGSGAFSINPGTITVFTGQSLTFSGSGGTLPYQFTVVTPGSGSPTVGSTTGDYTAGLSAGTDVIEIRDSDSPQNVATATVTVVASGADVDYSVTSVSNTGGTTGGGPLTGQFTFRNNGTSDASQTVTWKAYVSADTLLDGGDVQVDNSNTAPLTAGTTSSAISFSGTWPGYDRDYYLIVTVSSPDDESPANNALASAAVSVSGSPPPDIDYQVTVVSNNNTPASVESAISESFNLQNTGTADGSDSVFWTAYVSTNGTLDGGDTIVDSGTRPPLAAGASATGIAIDGSWPSSPGTYYLIVNVSASDEGITTNNDKASLSFTIDPPEIDYIVTAVTRTANVTMGDPITETFDLQNQGADPGNQTVYWSAYVSIDPTLDKPADTLVSSGTTGALGSGASTTGIPIGGTYPTVAGTRYLIVEASSSDESIGGNNDTSSASFLVEDPDVDYAIASISAPPATATGGTAISETFTYTNLGADDGQTTVYWTAYASTDGVLGGGGESVIDSGTAGALGAGWTSGAVPFGGFWPASPGVYSLIVKVSATDDVDTGNDWDVSGSTTDVSGITSDVDYDVATVTSTGGTTGGGALMGEFTFTNIGTTDGAETVNWEAYVSEDAVFGGGDILVDSGPAIPLNSSQTSGAIGFTGTWPAIDGTYYLIVSLSAADDGAVANNAGASGAVSVTGSPGPDVDYVVTAVSNVITPAVTGSSIVESFSLQNTGTTNGGQLVYWTAYASLDGVIDGFDTIVDSGSEAALDAGASSTGIPIVGTWPETGGTYYLIVEVTAGDDGTPGNNETVSGGFLLNDPVIDYVVTSVTNVNTPAGAGTGINESFAIQNQGANGGSATVNWTAYISTNTVVDAGDSIADSGTTGALGSAASSGPISIGGSWPATPGTYYLVVQVSAADESVTGNNSTASGGFTLTGASIIDYTVLSVSSSVTSVVTGNPITETFDVKNIGDTAGISAISWEAYVSPDPVFGGGDTLVNSGTIGAIAGGATSSGNAIGGTWPAPGNYYLIVRVTAPDETVSGWDDNSSGPFNSDYPPDYSVVSVDLPIVAFGGNVTENMTAASATASFSLYNDPAAGDGLANVTWAVYLSADTAVGGDQLLGTDTIGGFGAGATQGSFTFGDDDNLPATPGWYYILIEVTAGDDGNSSNNLYVSAPVAVWQTMNAEADIGEDDTILTADDYAVILNGGGPNDTVTINGLIDDNNPKSDFFKITTGPATTNLDIHLTWVTDNNTLDLYLFNEGGGQIGSSTQNTKDSEPFDPWNVTGLAPNSVYYVEVFTYFAGYGGQPYTLTITGY